ncbi:MAG: hypothetical protein K2N01_10200 [Lachnospiraceae bacterium]|nr:hypothetical protein [Lachnospiraceae bacterium]
MLPYLKEVKQEQLVDFNKNLRFIYTNFIFTKEAETGKTGWIPAAGYTKIELFRAVTYNICIAKAYKNMDKGSVTE